MGAAHCSVSNQSSRPICVITFNMADLLYKTYHTLYLIEPGEQQVVEANPDPNGLKLGIIYETRREKQEVFFHRFTCSNDSILTITAVDGNDIDYYGEGTSLQGKGKLREPAIEPFNMAAETLQNDLATRKEPGRAEQEVKKFFRNVKEQSEAVIQKVGDKLNIEVVHKEEPSVSTHSLNQNGVIQHDDHLNTNHTPSFYQPGNSARNPNSVSNVSSISVSSSTNNPSTRLGAQNQRGEDRVTQPPFSTSPKAADPAEETKRWEAELARAQKEKRWEAEIERIKQERLVRAAEEAEAAKHPVLSPEIRTAPVADANCKVCVIS